MKRKVPILIMCLMLVMTTISLNVSADEFEPEIIDEENDITGTLVDRPTLFSVLRGAGIVPIESFEFMDIKIAWFFENQAEPDYLFASIRTKNLEYTPLRAIYAIRWTYDDKNYAASCHTHSDGEFTWFSAGRVLGIFDNIGYKLGLIRDICGCSIDVENNIITYKIPKDLIGDPKPGDVLTYTNAWTGLRFINEIFTYLFGGEMVRDLTSYGNDYTVKY